MPISLSRFFFYVSCIGFPLSVLCASSDSINIPGVVAGIGRDNTSVQLLLPSGTNQTFYLDLNLSEDDLKRERILISRLTRGEQAILNLGTNGRIVKAPGAYVIDGYPLPERLQVQAEDRGFDYRQIPVASVQIPLRSGARIRISKSLTKVENLNSNALASPSLTAVWPQILSYLSNGIPTQVSIDPGVYREGELDLVIPEGDRSAIATTPLVINCTQTRGEVIFSGAEVLTEWIELGSDLYEAAWSNSAGFWAGLMGKNNPQRQIAQRRDVASIAGRFLLPVLLDWNEYLRKEGKIKGTAGSHGLDDAGMRDADPIGYWSFVGEKNPAAVLINDSFGIQENTHKLFIKTKDDPRQELFEISKRKYFLQVRNKSNLRIQGLTIRQYSSALAPEDNWKRDGALAIGTGGGFFSTTNIVLQQIAVENNSGSAVNLGVIEGLLVQDLWVEDNGGGGISGGAWLNAIFEDITVARNNWRGANRQNSWFAAGIKMHMGRQTLFRRLHCYGNLANGLWTDVGCTKLAIVDSIITLNYYGVTFEICKGPIVLENTAIVDNKSRQVFNYFSEALSFSNCLVGSGPFSKPWPMIATNWEGGKAVVEVSPLVTLNHSLMERNIPTRSSWNGKANWNKADAARGEAPSHVEFWLPGPVRFIDTVFSGSLVLSARYPEYPLEYRDEI